MGTLRHERRAIDPEGAEKRSYPEAFPALRPRYSKELVIPNGLVVSGDHSVRSTLAEALLQSGAAPILASSVQAAIPHMIEANLYCIVTQDVLPDGKYQDLLHWREQAVNTAPLIVISRAIDRRGCLEAIEVGAHDFLAYPLISGELQRIVEGFLDPKGSSRTVLSQFWD